MGKRGFKPEPIALKLMKGTYRPDKDGELADMPPVEKANLDSPAALGEIGLTVWQHEAPRLSDSGVLSESDRWALHTYCRTFDEVARLDGELAESGEYCTTDKGYICQHPAVNQRFKWLDLRRRYEAEFGLTPSSRSSVKVQRKAEKSASASLGKRTG